MSPCCVPSSVNSTTIHPGCPISTRISRLILKPLLPSGSPVNDLCQFSSPEHSPPCLATESITRPFQLVPLPPALTPNPPHTHTHSGTRVISVKPSLITVQNLVGSSPCTQTRPTVTCPPLPLPLPLHFILVTPKCFLHTSCDDKVGTTGGGTSVICPFIN